MSVILVMRYIPTVICLTSQRLCHGVQALGVVILLVGQQDVRIRSISQLHAHRHNTVPCPSAKPLKSETYDGAAVQDPPLCSSKSVHAACQHCVTKILPAMPRGQRVTQRTL